VRAGGRILSWGGACSTELDEVRARLCTTHAAPLRSPHAHTPPLLLLLLPQHQQAGARKGRGLHARAQAPAEAPPGGGDSKAFRGDEHVDDEDHRASAERVAKNRRRLRGHHAPERARPRLPPPPLRGNCSPRGRPLVCGGAPRGGQRRAQPPSAPAAAVGARARQAPPAGPSDLDDEDEDDGISNDDGEDEEGDDDGLSDGGEDDGGLDGRWGRRRRRRLLGCF